MSLQLFGLTLHAYGFILGIAAVVGIELARFVVAKTSLAEKKFNQLLIWAVGGGVLGGRLWHVMTDWAVYADDPLASVAVWNGGMSIIGAVVGAIVALRVARLFFTRSKSGQRSVVSTEIWQFLDAAVFGLPAAQAIGRLGNYVNYELFGYPTDLPWGLYVPPVYRPAGFIADSHFHPLFAYEMIVLILFAGATWLLFYRKNWWKYIGTGVLFYSYLLFYAVVRICLEFLRIQKTVFLETPLSINQVVLVVVACWCIIQVWRRRQFFLRKWSAKSN